MVTRTYYRQSVSDAREVHICRRDKQECERRADAATVRAQDAIAREARERAHADRLALRPTWGVVLLGVAVGAATALCVPAAQGDPDARIACGVSVAVATGLGVIVWRW